MQRTDYEGSYHAQTFEDPTANIRWFIRTSAKISCTLILTARSYTERPIRAWKTGLNGSGLYYEIPLIIPSAIAGLATACLTGFLAITVLSAKTVWVFRKIAPSVVEALVVRLFWEAHEGLVAFVKSIVLLVWSTIGQAFDISRFYRPSPDATPEFTGADHSLDSSLPLNNALQAQEDGVLTTEFESLGGWKISETLNGPNTNATQNEDMYIPLPHTRRHQRTATGGSLRLSGTNSPELVKTPLYTGGESLGQKRRRGNGSGGSSPESYFRMKTRTDTNDSGSVLELRKHSRSGSSSTSSLRSAGRRSVRDIS